MIFQKQRLRIAIAPGVRRPASRNLNHVYYTRDAGCIERGMFCILMFSPGVDSAAQRHDVTGRLYRDIVGVDLRIAFQGVLNLGLHARGADFRLYVDLIG
jgi:hypothetical protein